jgi:hypothetical protein
MYTAFLAQWHLDLDEFHNREWNRIPGELQSPQVAVALGPLIPTRHRSANIRYEPHQLFPWVRWLSARRS